MKCWCGGAATWSIAKAAYICLESEFHNPLPRKPNDNPNIIYVAGPMSGLPQNNYPAFNHAEKLLQEAGYTVVNPARSTLKAAHYTDFLRHDLKMLLECEAVATLTDWEHSTGARNEVMVAGTLGMPVRTVGFWLSVQGPTKGTQEALPMKMG